METEWIDSDRLVTGSRKRGTQVNGGVMDPASVKTFRKQWMSFPWGPGSGPTSPRCPPLLGLVPTPHRPGPHVFSLEDKPGGPSDDLLSLSGCFYRGNHAAHGSLGPAQSSEHVAQGWFLWLTGLSPAACRPGEHSANGGWS